MFPHNQRDRPVGGLVFVLSAFLRQGDAQHKRNAHGQQELQGQTAQLLPGEKKLCHTTATPFKKA